uniref:DUF377 n=1 Tax=uncultured Syntrophothermus sp. TaxID=905007 RepID=A0A060BZE9_9FIRM|nr:DUF377 [uncultured Syntrophothermus sp.]
MGLAISSDGYHCEREPEPVLSPSEDYERFGCEDPCVTAVDGVYYLTYTGWERENARLCLATSTDLHHWTKRGPLFKDFDTFAVTKPSWLGLVEGRRDFTIQDAWTMVDVFR